MTLLLIFSDKLINIIRIYTYKMLTRKDLIALNQQFSKGQIVNESSLDFVLKQTYRSPHWFKTMCLLARTIVLDHVFEDGNKRTGAAVIMAYLEINNYHYDPDKISQIAIRIAKARIRDTTKIGILIKNATL